MLTVTILWTIKAFQSELQDTSREQPASQSAIETGRRAGGRADAVTQSSTVPPASFSRALKSPLTAVACGEEKDIFLPREMVVGGGGWEGE